MINLKSFIRDVPDFPKPGILFKDITPVLQDAALFRRTCGALAAPWRASGVTHVLGIESRGFIFGTPVAIELEAAFVPLRKPRKLPFTVLREDYGLEYGKDTLEVHQDAFGPGAKVLVVDDLLATGGTAAAAVRLARRLDAEVQGVSAVIGLDFLPWRTALEGVRVETLVRF